jgi:hypothetical protein
MACHYSQVREATEVLNSAIIGIKTLKGHGCPECKFAHDRVRNVTTHMKNMHSASQEMEPSHCLIQIVFSSNLRSFWKVRVMSLEEETTDEGLLALRHFSADVRRLEQEDSRSAVGILHS